MPGDPYHALHVVSLGVGGVSLGVGAAPGIRYVPDTGRHDVPGVRRLPAAGRCGVRDGSPVIDRREALLRGNGLVLKRIGRTSSDDDLDGFVLGVGRRWVLMAALSDSVELDGYIVFPLRDVGEVEDRDDKMPFIRRALTLQRSWPPLNPRIMLNLNDSAALLRGIAATAPVITVFTERIDDDVCYVGVPMNVTEHSVDLREIRHDARWRPEPSRWAYDEITRIDFADKYAAIIYAVASESDPAPN